jgi:hypothetical protein
MKNCISVLAIAFLLTSCGHGTTHHFPKEKGLTNPAEIVIVRNKNFACGGQSAILFFDELEIAQIRTGEYVSFSVEPGVHQFKAVPAIGRGSLPLLGRGRLFVDNFEEGKKHYLLISLFDMGDYSFSETLSSALSGIGHGCDFEIEKISEEEGLKRIKSSKNLIEKEEAPKSGAKVAPTKTESKRVSTFNPEEPWTGKWKIEGHKSAQGIWTLKQSRNKIISTEDSMLEIEGRAVGSQFEGKYEAMNVNNYFYSFKVKISSDGLSFKGITSGQIGNDLGQIRGVRVE